MFRSNEAGTIEIDEERYAVSKNYMIQLRKILDRFEIHYILDRVSFHSTESSVSLLKAIYNTNIWKVEKDGGVSLDNQFGHSAKFMYDCFVISNLDPIKIRLKNNESLTSHEKLVLRLFAFKA